MAAYRAALQERTRERVPLHWATTQNNLGNALQTLGERETGTARLQESLIAIESASGQYQDAGLDHYAAYFEEKLTTIRQLIAQRVSE